MTNALINREMSDYISDMFKDVIEDVKRIFSSIATNHNMRSIY